MHLTPKAIQNYGYVNQTTARKHSNTQLPAIDLVCLTWGPGLAELLPGQAWPGLAQPDWQAGRGWACCFGWPLLCQLFDYGFLAGTGCVSNSHAFKDFACLPVHEAA